MVKIWKKSGIFINKKRKKEHGDKGVFLGKTTDENDKIVIIDDVLTTGTTKEQAIKEIEKTGAKVIGLVIAVDRLEKKEDNEKTATQLFLKKQMCL